MLLFEQYLEDAKVSDKWPQTTVDSSGFVMKLLFVFTVQKALQTSILITRNRLDRLLVLFFVLLSARVAEHGKSLVFEKEKR